MNLRRLLFILFALGSILTAGSAFLGTQTASAQVDTGLSQVGQTVKLPSTDPRVIAVRIINIALGVIGIVLVVLVLYAGFLWMTAGGDGEKVNKAKKVLTNAVIGLVIVLSAWAITRFIISSLLQATQEGGGVSGTGTGYSGGFGGGAGTSFRIKSITPQGATPLKPRNVEVKIVFTKNVDEASASAIAVLKEGGTTVGGSIQVNGSLVTFTPTQACPPPNETRKCFDSNSTFRIKVGNTVKSTGGQVVTCGGFAPSCEATFSTSDLVDTQPPTVAITYPSDGMPVPENSLVDVLARSTDDSGVATVQFFDGAVSFALDGPNSTNTPLSFNAKGVWDTAGAPRGAHSLSALAFDLDTNSTKSAGVSVMVRPEHCFNNKIDTDLGETGLNCGGDPNSAEYCGACSGSACTSNGQCSSGFCQNGICVEKPIIKAVSPLNGKAGTFVTIAGFNFGTSTGVVKFLGNPNDPSDDKEAFAPQACTKTGTATWSNSQAIVEVPAGAASGPIELTNASSKLSDRTDQEPGPPIDSFVVDNTVHPGLCAILPPESTVNTEVDAIGAGLGATPGSIIFGSIDYTLQASPWSDSKAHFKVPIVNNGPYEVWAKTAAGLSNAVEFSVIEKAAGESPQLLAIDPATGPQQEYVTLTGKNFGYTVGTVIFTGQTPNGPMEAIGDTSFPAACASGFWRDDSIVVKVPSKFKNGEAMTSGKYQVRVKPVRSDNKESNSLDFTLDTTLIPKPGICAIQPSVGPEGTAVKIFGERLGLDKPIVTFFPNKNALVESNTTQEIDTSVPQNASTGPVRALVQMSQGATTSNAVNFQVRNCNEAPQICGPADKFQCCPTGECRGINDVCGVVSTKAEFAWQMSTGLIPLAPYVIEECRPDLTPAPTPSPSPWLNRAGGDQAPVDAAITMRFSQRLEPTTVKPANFKLYACTGANDDPCTTKIAVDYTLGYAAENDQQDVVTLRPNGKLATSTTYLVTVSTNVKGAGPTGAYMLERKDCGQYSTNPKLGYCFKFKTRATDEPSQIGAVGVTPHTYTFHDTGVQTDYEAVPESLNDRCIVINCDLFNWNWSTGDQRGSITNTQGANNYGLCNQKGWGVSETGNVPVDVYASLVNSSLKGLGLMYVNFIPPHVVDYGPKCDSACSNAQVWADFSTRLDETTVQNPDNIVIRKCYNENCYETELGPPIVPTGVSLVENGTEVQIDHANFEPGAFYWVLLRGGPNAVDPNTKENIGIKGPNGIPMAGTNHPMGFTWTFRVKTGQDAFCKADRVEVRPQEKFETNIDGRQLFTGTPFSKPDTCSANGQRLVNSGSVTWASSNRLVADFYNYNQPNGPLVATSPKDLPLGCSGKCLATGSGGLYGKLAICGNGKIETTDKNYCKIPQNAPPGTNVGTTPKGDVCYLYASGAQAGEECEPQLDNLCDPEKCLLKPVRLTTSGGTCGNGNIDFDKGEECDFGTVCVGGGSSTSSPAVPDYTPCGDTPLARAIGVTEQTCVNAGGQCSMFNYRGCSAGCRHLGAIAGKSTCGNGDVLADGKDCDDGNKTDGDGCSSDCLHEGSKPNTIVAAVCGNGVLEPGETCEAEVDSNNKPVLVNGAPVFPPGCDATKCLHTGTLACTQSETAKCCGNGKLDAGEDCDDGNTAKGDGCSSVCLLEGSSAYYWGQNSIEPSFCANGILEKGEQCELRAPSNLVAQQINYKGLYSANPPASGYAAFQPVLGKSFAPAPSNIDRTQLAFIVGVEEPDPVTGRSSSTLSAVMMEQTGRATYGLQCGNTSEAFCQPDENNLPRGLDKFGCCRLRPHIINSIPVTPSPDTDPPTTFCRNIQITVEFKERMDSGSVVNNFQVAQAVESGQSCPPGTTELVPRAPLTKGWWNMVKAWWHELVAWFTGGPALAEKWCVGGITGQLHPIGDPKAPTKFAFALDNLLPANAKIRVIFKGDPNLLDNADLNKREGIKTLAGVVYDATQKDLSWDFKTNDKICALNTVTINDVTGLLQEPPPPELPGEEHPFLFINRGNRPETRYFEAVAQSIENGRVLPLSSTKEYEWRWQPWETSDSSLVNYAAGQVLPESTNASFTTQQENGGATQRNGTAILTAGLVVTNDTVNVPSTVSSTLYGVAPVTVLACENPWPSLQTAPFADTQDWQMNKFPMLHNGTSIFTQPDPLNQKTLFYNFSTLYCRDAGEAHKTTDDLPALVINPVPRTKTDADKGILRQYLFTFSEPELKGDGIGIRIMENPRHLSPIEWYLMQGFIGNPKPVKVDGYPALQDGSSIYVAAANQPATDGPIYSNIYIISHNQNASKTTLLIYDQLVKYLTFNINILGQSNNCHYVQGSQYQNSQVFMPEGGEGQLVVPVKCSADADCVALDSNKKLYCASNKLKLARDTQRMADFQLLSRKLAAVYSYQGKYPQLTAGTFIKGMTNSRWASWWDELGKELVGAAPIDPLNHFLSCGRCSGGQPCATDADCAGQATTTCKGGRLVDETQNGTTISVWQEDANIDPQTCWNTKQAQFICPQYQVDNPFSVSRIYQYRTFAGATQYQVAAEFEVRPMTANKEDWWYPPLTETVYRCFSTSTFGQICSDENGQPSDALCRNCASQAKCGHCKISKVQCSGDDECSGAGDACVQDPIISGSCRPVGGSFKYSGICTNQSFAEKGVCGDGVKNTEAKTCSLSYKACTSDADCAPNGGNCIGEVCELGETRSVPCCVAGDGKCQGKLDGHRLQTCIACTHFDTDPRHPQCVPDVKCGNGRIDKHCAVTVSQSCLSDADCPNVGTTSNHEACVPAEQCDDGVLNGTYGHCAVGCGSYGGFCGNGQLDAGEVCDNGANNGQWSPKQDPASCALDCKGIGPYCGDQTVQAPNEECDGQTETSQKALCQGTSILCDTDADCPTGKKCGALITLAVWSDPSMRLGLVDRFLGFLGVRPVSAAPADQANQWNNAITGSGSQTIPIPVQSTISLTYLNAQGQKVTTTGEADCGQLYVKDTDGSKRATQRSRSCQAPGTAKACQWGTWSACIPAGVCGDGIKDPNEECDDGQQNGDNKPCTSQCKKNVCGDGKLNVGVEECDNGAQNGQPTCNADYNSSCLSCSQGCKFMASAGGYCGDGIKNGPEQCDGKDGLKDTGGHDVTCKMLGYDYADDSTQFVNALSSTVGASSGGSTGIGGISGLKQFQKSGTTDYKFYQIGTAGGGTGFGVDGLLGKFSVINSSNSNGSANTISVYNLGIGGVAGGGNLSNSVGTLDYGESFWQNLGATDKKFHQIYNPEAAKCTSACTFGGCKKCSQDPGTGVIQGRVYDAVFQQVVANARVTLTYKGVKVDETYTDANGVFTFKTLNTNKACDSYKIVIDMYDDNPCTNPRKPDTDPPDDKYCYRNFTPPWTYPYSIDESKTGGYFPFTSEVFSAADFDSTVNGKDSDDLPHIDIFPRPERGMAYAAITWRPVTGNERVWYKMHTILPKDYAFTAPIPQRSTDQIDWDNLNQKSERCTYDDRPAVVSIDNQNYWVPCLRDIFHYQLGRWDTATFPYTRLICLHRSGEKTDGWIDQRSNGCPIEGYEQCMKNKGGNYQSCSKSSTSDQKCSDCGLDANHVDNNGNWTCAKAPHFADCGNPMSFGPLTTLVNFAPMVASNESDPVRFYFVAGDGGSSNLKHLLGWEDAKFRVYAAVTKLNGTSELKSVEKPPDPGADKGWAWHIADLDPKNQEIKVINALEGKDGAANSMVGCLGVNEDYKNQNQCQKPIDGLAAWSYWFQASGNGGYCVQKAYDYNNETKPLTWKLLDHNAVCWHDSETSACTAAGYHCDRWSYTAWHWANY